MIIYNVTIHVDDSVHLDWREWMQDHIPKVLGTGLFFKAIFTKVMVEEEMGGTTYSVQYFANSKTDLDHYHQHHAQALQAEGKKRFGDKILAFRTELQFVDEFIATKQ